MLPTSFKRLILFDIDETMISSHGAGKRAIGKVIAEHFGHPNEKANVPMSGRTDPEIMRMILRSCGLNDETIDEKLSFALEVYLEVLQKELKNDEHYLIHPGVIELLEQLEKTEGMYLALLTGNIERGAFIKLTKFNLHSYFTFGAFGSDSANRMELPKVAQGRALEKLGIEFHPDEMVVIGDAVNDVLCAKGFGAKSIAVNTGKTSWDELAELKPDYLFKDLSNTGQVVDAIKATRL